MNLEDSFKYRSSWMGFAILWVMFFHSGLEINAEPLKTFKLMGYGGVDMFLFASGLGCHYSLSRNPDAISFFKRRARRILPTWWTFMLILWTIPWRQIFDPPWEAFIGDALLLEGFADWHYTFNWYLSAMLMTYLLAPYCSSLAARSSTLRSFLLIELLIFAITIPFWKHEHLMFMSRLPIFYVGIAIAALAQRGAIIDRRAAIGLFIATVVGVIALVSCSKIFPPSFINDFGLWWYPFILIAPGLCLGLSWILSRAPSLIDRALSTVGALSFEIYLVHILLTWIIQDRALALDDVGWLGFFAASMVGSIGLKFLVTTLERRLSI
ncbi:MAG: acyltransferase [Selenomonadaceae bacterium]|nr:acyltransferase [Selenomonadaceae bacterium]